MSNGNGSANSDYIGKKVFGPCINGLSFQSDVLLPSVGEWDNKIAGGDNAIFTKSNCLKGNGTNSLVSKTFTDNTLYYADKITINYSTNGTTRLSWITGQSLISGLYSINTTTKLLQFFYDGTNRFYGWIDSVLVEVNGGTYIPIIDLTFSSGSIVEEYNRTTNENRVVNIQYVEGIVRDIPVSSTLKII